MTIAFVTTANQGLRVVDGSTDVWELPDALLTMAEDVEKQLVMRFVNMAEFTSKVTSPEDGMVFWVTADNALYVYADGAPQRVWPTTPMFSSGSGAPTGAGEAGAVYFDLDS